MPNSQLVADLRAARARIADPKRWSKGEMAYVRGYNCAETATRCGDVDRQSAQLQALKAALPSGFQRYHVYVYNDDERTTHADIVSLYDRAIAAAEREAR